MIEPREASPLRDLRERLAFLALHLGSGPWARRHCALVTRGTERLAGLAGRRRVYVFSHPTSFDIFVLLHAARGSFHLIIDAASFTYPVAGFLLRSAGFVPVHREGGRGDDTIEAAARIAASGRPLLVSLRGGDVTSGRPERIRTGAVRIARLAEADLVPLHLAIEPGKRIDRSFEGLDGRAHPYSNFTDTLFFLSVLEPLPFEAWSAGTEPDRAGNAGLAEALGEAFDREDAALAAGLAARPEAYRDLRRRGGAREGLRL